MPKVIVNSGYIKSSAHYINYLEYAGNKLEAQTLVLNDGTEVELEPDELYDVTQSDFRYIEIKIKDGSIRKLNKSQYINYVNSVEDGLVENKLVRNNGIVEDLEPVTYLKYIGHRPSVEKHKNASHGLFDLQGMANMDDVKQTILDNEKSIKWSHIISLKDEDAERLGYDNRQAWEDLIRAKAYDISKIYNIPPEHLKIYAAFHKRDHHPHCHLFMFSDANNSNHGFVKGGTEAMIKASERMRSIFTNEIFKDDIQSLKIDKNALRLELRAELNKYIYAIGNKNYMPNNEIVNSFSNLAAGLVDYQGKASYAYLSARQKKLVNDVIAKAVSSDANIGKIFQQLVDNQREFISLYNDDSEKVESRLQDYIDHFFEPTLNNDYRVLHNAVIKQAMLYNQHMYPSPEPGVVRKENSVSNDVDDFDDEYVAQPQKSAVVRKEKTSSGNSLTAFDRYVSDDEKNPDAGIEYRIASMLLEGKEVEADFEKAIEYLKQSAEKGNQYAQYKLGKIYLSDEYNVYNFSAAIGYLEQSAEQGNQYAQYTLGKLYLSDDDINDVSIAVMYLKQAADQNNEFAQYTLGVIYSDEEFDGADEGLAKEYFIKSAEQGNQYAQYKLGKMLIGEITSNNSYGFNLGLGLEWLKKSAEQGNQYAQYTLGKIYLSDNYGVKSVDKAIEYLEQSSKQNNQFAQYTLGVIYSSEEFEMLDERLAEEYFTKSAEQNNEFAQYRLGKMLTGKVTASNNYGFYLGLGLNWLKQSAEQNNQFAQYELGRIYLSDEYGVKNINMSIKYFKQAAEQGNQYAQFALGKIYLSDEYGIKDIDVAVSYLNQAAEQNNEFAQYQLGKLYYFGDETISPDKELGMHYLKLSAEQGNEYAKNTINNIVNRNNAQAFYSAKLMLSELARIMALMAVNSFHQNPDEENKDKKDKPKFEVKSHRKHSAHYQAQHNTITR